ncbi:MAG: DUF378 domain-containing protein [Rickettsiales bacterium]|jgi:uncharacterized membrane protein YuzA (DUF378 family)|nr:DUF378 domain-containing protein [Rickettsiales bacterium]
MKKFMNTVCMPLALFGAIDWGLIGIFRYDVIGAVLGSSMAAQIVQILIGLSGLGVLFGWFGKGGKGKK